MVLHLVLPVSMCDYKAWPHGESVRAELTLSRKSDDNYACWKATVSEFITSRQWTDVLDLDRKRTQFSQMDETAQWNASGNNRQIHLQVFGMGVRDNRIPDRTIVGMIEGCDPHITVVKWTLVTSAQKLLDILRDKRRPHSAHGVHARRRLRQQALVGGR